MKNIFIFFSIFITILSCNESANESYIINGKAKGVYNGIRVFLHEISDNERILPIDTTMVIDETFKFSGKLSYPRRYVITINGIKGRLDLMVENSLIEVNIDKEKLINSTVKGSNSHIKLQEYKDEIFRLRDEQTRIRSDYYKAYIQKDKEKIDSLNKKATDQSRRITNYPLEFIEENPNNYVVLSIFKSQLRNPNLSIEKVESIFSNLSEDLKISSEGKRISKKIKQLKAKSDANKLTSVGAIAPKFSASDVNGNNVSLNDILKKGKITILDFWAAWCAPCRKENPNLVKLYNQYHDKGLEIIGVSLDGSSRQKEPKKEWLEAIKKDKLTWTQVSNLKHYRDPIAELYNIKYIPASFILNSNGKIIAKNLRGRALENKINELLNP